jgi:ATP-dependent Clp protease adaptor protein ClpS
VSDKTSSAAVADTAVEETGVRRERRREKKSRRQPPYHVILWNDEEHTEYVIRMLKELFAHPEERGMQLADAVNSAGRVIVLTTTREHAELKRDQIHAYGKDDLVRSCKGSMSASIEPATD